MTLQRAMNDMTDPIDKHEPIENSDPVDAIEPIQRIEPIEPTDSTDPLEPIDSTEWSDHSDYWNWVNRWARDASAFSPPTSDSRRNKTPDKGVASRGGRPSAPRSHPPTTRSSSKAVTSVPHPSLSRIGAGQPA